MREIELWTADGHFVAVVEIQPFPDKAMPKVVMWGDRVFRIDEERLQVDRWRYDECFAVFALTQSPGRPRNASDYLAEQIRAERTSGYQRAACRACGRPLLPENVRVADGCPCNSGRGINHGLVDQRTCTCSECDPAKTGSTRYPEAVSGVGPPDKGADLLAAVAREKGGNIPPVPPVDRTARCTVGEALAPGVPNTEDRGDGQHKGYVILCDEERAKGFVRPVRDSYIHVGARPKYPTRDLTPEERERHKDIGYVQFEPYPQPRPDGSSVTGRYWTEKQLRSGCGAKTTMGRKLAETYARDPTGFYDATFCVRCGAHFPVGADGEFVWDGTDEKVGT